MGVVYLLGDWEREGMYKIGVTRGSIEKRIKKLQTGNSSEVYVVDYYTTDHPFFIEKNMHLKFMGKKVLNEWYELSLEEMKDFKKHCREIEDMLESLEDNPYMRRYLKNNGTASKEKHKEE